MGAHFTATAVPPLHVVVVSLWQTMAWPQSVSVWQGAGRQVREVAGGVVVGRQAAPGGHAVVGVGVAVLAWQVRPCAQSLLLAQVCALANPGMARTVTRAVIHRSCFVGVMTFPLTRVGRFHSSISISRANRLPVRWAWIPWPSRLGTHGRIQNSDGTRLEKPSLAPRKELEVHPQHGAARGSSALRRRRPRRPGVFPRHARPRA